MSNKENEEHLSSNDININSGESDQSAFKKGQRGKHVNEELIIEQRRQTALAQMKYLLSISEKFSDVYRKTLIVNSKKGKNSNPTLGDLETIKTEVKNSSKKRHDIDITQHLTYFEGGKLHPYQIDGVTWLYMLYIHGTNGILADEMGLGKTIQIIAFICVLLKQNVSGPFLIVTPLSTIPNWENEFKKFAPKVPVVVVCGTAQDRRNKLYKVFKKYTIGSLVTYPVVIVSYQIPLIEMYNLKKLSWSYIIVDEGQRIKNPNSQLSLRLRELNSKNRLILSGTPLQNNLKELWALLNFLLPTFFTNMEAFSQVFLMDDMQDENEIIKQEESRSMVNKMHKVLAPFMLRRVKKDVLDMVPKKELFVYCPLTDLQKKLYDFVLEKNMYALRGIEKEEIDVNAPRAKRRCAQNRKAYIEPEAEQETPCINIDDIKTSKSEIEKFNKTLIRLTMQNPLMMLRKIVSHPYLVHFPLDPNGEKRQLLIDDNLIESSGKLKVLDVLLPHLKAKGHKVLLFSQLCIAIDLIEEYMLMKGINYRRLDGSHSLDDRADNIKDFNDDPDIFVFLLSTRAGGLGLNLASADTVIFWDRDWNPQMDIQAQDRCHRIGQTKPVVIYTLVSKNTIDERVLKVGKMKRLLEKVIILDGKFKSPAPNKMLDKDTIVELREALKSKENDDAYILTNESELNRLLDRSDLYAAMQNNQSV
ncbi:lymphoid-specific helicase-like [Rhynchophorus ferrugineus]|uniref:lymphoid-specific helicase-like n=1 Tax=Rhynchophorus ferrugineus TaxID=354439 RepID=UPI003FCE746C